MYKKGKRVVEDVSGLAGWTVVVHAARIELTGRKSKFIEQRVGEEDTFAYWRVWNPNN